MRRNPWAPCAPCIHAPSTPHAASTALGAVRSVWQQFIILKGFKKTHKLSIHVWLGQGIAYFSCGERRIIVILAGISRAARQILEGAGSGWFTAQVT